MTPLTASAHIGERARTMGLDGRFELFRYLAERLVPGDLCKLVPYSFQRPLQPILVVLIMKYLQSFPAIVPLAARIFLVRTHFDYAVRLNQNFEAAVLRTTNAGCLFPHRILLLKSDDRGGPFCKKGLPRPHPKNSYPCSSCPRQELKSLDLI